VLIVACGITFAVGGAWLALHLRRTRLGVEPAVPGLRAPHLDSRPTIRGAGQILFAEPQGAGLRVDCVLVGTDTGGAPPGSMLTLCLFPPRVPCVTAPFEALLARWADDVQVVDLELRPCPKGWRLHLDDGDLPFTLEILAPLRVAESGA